jgi:hypothetical protein
LASVHNGFKRGNGSLVKVQEPSTPGSVLCVSTPFQVSKAG